MLCRARQLYSGLLALMFGQMKWIHLTWRDYINAFGTEFLSCFRFCAYQPPEFLGLSIKHHHECLRELLGRTPN